METRLDNFQKHEPNQITRLAELSKGNLHYQGDGSLPLDKWVDPVLGELRIQALLMPIRGGDAVKGTRKRISESPARGARKKANRKTGDYANAKAGNSKGKAAGKDKKGNARMPQELIGMESSHNGRRICYGYNMVRGCSESVNSANECRFGLHVCCRRGCGGNHTQSKCPRR